MRIREDQVLAFLPPHAACRLDRPMVQNDRADSISGGKGVFIVNGRTFYAPERLFVVIQSMKRS
jgi:hypothetical protein